MRGHSVYDTGAGNGIRTRDLCLGKATLYQLSYSRAYLSQYHNETDWSMSGIVRLLRAYREGAGS